MPKKVQFYSSSEKGQIYWFLANCFKKAKLGWFFYTNFNEFNPVLSFTKTIWHVLFPELRENEDFKINVELTILFSFHL